MANHYDVTRQAATHYACYTFRDGQLAPPESCIGVQKIPISILHRTFSFLDPASWSHMPFVNKAWYHASRGKVLLLHFSHEEEVKSKVDSYTIKRNITRRDAQEIFAQTGMEIGFTPGQAQINNFSLGRGTFGEFCIARSAQKAHFVGIKITRGKNASEREAQIQLSLRDSPSIMPTLDLCRGIDLTGSPALYQVMELGGLGSTATLKPFLDRLVDQRFKEQVLFCIAEGLFVGLSGMHRKGCYHLDMKPDNLVVRQDGQVFLIDFGCSHRSENPFIDPKQTDGDWCYFSPERATATAAFDATKIDAWAAGITLLMLSGFANIPAVKTVGEAEAARLALLAQAEGLHANSAFLALVKALLHTDPSRRLTPAQAMQHPWFLEMQKASVEWRNDTVAYLRELVQSLHRERRAYNVLSPQDLPLPHFTALVERRALQERMQKLLLGPSSYKKTVVTGCHGIGGVGKTQFVTHLVHQRNIQVHFGLKLWFRSSDNRSSLETQTIVLARELSLCDEKTSFEKALQKLHKYLAKQAKPWLMVFDNAQNAGMLAPFFPPSGGHVLIASRSKNWLDSIPIDPFTPEEGEFLVQRLLQTRDPLSRELCQELGFLPLGIAQACAFIRNQKLTIATYLEQLRKDAAMIGKDETLFGKKLPNSMLLVRQTTLQALQVINHDAFEQLYVLAYLAPDNIPMHLMQKLLPVDAQAILKRFALMQESQNTFSINRLVQLAMRAKQSQEGQMKALTRGMNVLSKAYEANPTTFLELQNNQELFAHGEAIVNHVEQLLDACPALIKPLAETLSWLGMHHSKQGHFDKHKVCAERALQLAQKVYGEQHHDLAPYISELGVAWLNLGNITKALHYFEMTLAIDKKFYRGSHSNVADSLNNFGIALQDSGDARQGLKYLEQALDIYKNVFGEQHPNVAHSFVNIGRALYDLGEAQQALQCCQNALAIYRKTHGEQNPKIVSILEIMGKACLTLGNAEEALKHFENALAINRQGYGEQDYHTARSLMLTGSALRALKNDRKALQCYVQALVIDKTIYGEHHPNVADILGNIGNAYIGLGETQNALNYLKQALASYKKAFSMKPQQRHKMVAQVYGNIGIAYYKAGNLSKAVKYFQKAYQLALQIPSLGPDHPITKRYKNGLDHLSAEGPKLSAAAGIDKKGN